MNQQFRLINNDKLTEVKTDKVKHSIKLCEKMMKLDSDYKRRVIIKHNLNVTHKLIKQKICN